LTRNHVQNIERGSSRATLAAIIRISEALGIRLVELLEEAESLVRSPAKLRAAVQRHAADSIQGRPKKRPEGKG
jgi:transcriptional regulator with XRE-family HTH domain